MIIFEVELFNLDRPYEERDKVMFTDTVFTRLMDRVNAYLNSDIGMQTPTYVVYKQLMYRPNESGLRMFISYGRYSTRIVGERGNQSIRIEYDGQGGF